MKVENLRSLIKESIQEYISEVEESGNIAAQEAKVRACDEAIANRMKKINMEGLDEAYHDMMSEEKMKELKAEVKALENYKKKATKILEKLLEKKENKGKPKVKKDEEDVVTDAVTEEAPIDETDIRAEMELEETAINESFLKMQKLAGVITEAQYNKLLSEAIKTTTNSPEVNELFGFGGGTKFKDGAIVYIKKGNRSSEEFETVPRKINFGINKPQKIQGKFSYFVTAPKQTDGNFYNSGGLWVAEENIKLA